MNVHRPIDTDQVLCEIRDRMRRVETRVTKVSNHLGVDSGVERPRFDDGKLYLTSRKASVDDMLAAIPPGWDKEDDIDVFVGDNFLLNLVLRHP